MDRNTYAFGDDAGNLAARAREIGLQHRAALLRESGDRHSYAAGMLGSTKLQLAVLASFDPDYDHDDEPREPRRASANDAAGFRPLERVPSWLAEVEERRQQRSEHGSLESLRGGFTLNQAFLAVIKSAVGPAVLYMPKGFQEGGLCFSLGMLVLSFALFSLGATRLLEAWEGCRKSYAAMMGLARHKGVLVVRFTIVAQQCGICLTYFIFVATNLRELVMYACPSFAAPSLAQCCLLQNFALTNLVANALILYSLVVLAVYGTIEVVEHQPPLASLSLFNKQSFYLFVGTSAFVYEGSAALVVPLQEAVRKDLQPQFSTLYVRTCGMIIVTYIVFGAELGGLRNWTETVLTVNLHPSPWKASVQLAYSLAVVFTFPLQLFPAIQILKSRRRQAAPRTTKLEGNVARFALVVALCLVAIVNVHSLDKLVALIGGLLGIPLAFIYPLAIHLKLVPDADDGVKLLNRCAITCGALLCLACTGVTVATW
ncbi:amino acid transmembrane transporter [Aureococcus anophagefferens]|nr:amino acid transmembrane transporter [Aureococcus anophagefferens]